MKLYEVSVSLKIEKKPTCKNKLTWTDGRKDGQYDYYMPPFGAIKISLLYTESCGYTTDGNRYTLLLKEPFYLG